QLDGSPDHIRKTGLLASFFHLICESKIVVTEGAEKFRPCPRWNRVQIRAGADDVESVAAKLKQQIAGVLSLTTFRGRNKLCRAAAHCDFNVPAIHKLGCDL